MNFSATIAAAAAGKAVRAALLCEFQFASGTERVWGGEYPIIAGGYEWRGMSPFLSVDGLSARGDLGAEPMTFKLSGVDAGIVAIAKDAANEAKNRPVNVWLQFFDESWAPLDAPILMRAGIMDQLRFQTVGLTQRDIECTAEGIFVARNYAPYAYYTDRDQNARFPGDRGLEYVGGLIYKVVTWPNF